MQIEYEHNGYEHSNVGFKLAEQKKKKCKPHEHTDNVSETRIRIKLTVTRLSNAAKAISSSEQNAACASVDRT